MRVSVYVPTKNRLDLLRLAVNSVLGQTYPDVELIIVDDASTDGTWPYLLSLPGLYPNVKVFRNESSRGACVARNIAIRASTGDFVTGLDDDDEFLPDHLNSLISYWKVLTHGGGQAPACLYTQCVYRNGSSLRESRKMSNASAEDLIDVNAIGNQIFAPREHFLGAGLFDEGMPAWQDFEFFYRILRIYGKARLLDRATYVFDVTPRPDRISSGQKGKIMKAARLMIQKHANGNDRVAQRLLLQVYGDYYGFAVGWRDVWGFARLGLWKGGYRRMMSLWLLGRRRA
jgi:glycosyltransferase involved in cell wall biosynthesis